MGNDHRNPASPDRHDTAPTSDPGAPLEEAIDTMVEHSIKRLVVDGQADGVGILTTTDVMQELSPDLDRVVEMFAEG